MKILFFDTETDSLIDNHAMPLEKQPMTLEVFTLLMDGNGDEIESRSHLFAQRRPIPAEVTNITGIDGSMLVGRPAIAERLPDIVKEFEEADLIVAHNIAYDKSVIEFECMRAGIPLPKWPNLLCTVEATIWIKGFRLSLTALHTELFGEKFEGAHRAETDVRALAKCYWELVKRDMV